MNQNTAQITATTPKAFSYLRFSTPEQMKGDSLRRQTALAAEWTARHNVELDERSYRDLGISAYRGANAETGMLGEFLDAVRTGVVPRGSYLLIESLDRLSRNKPRKAVHLLEMICDEKISVVTLSDGKVYTSESLDDDPMAFMWAFMVATRANEESATKARRLKAAWIGKRQRAAEKPLTAKGPAWLRLVDGKWTVMEDRAVVVRRIFAMMLEGAGQHRIAEALNREAVPCFGDAAMWHRSYVKKISENPAVVGTLVPHVVEYVEGKKVRKPLDPVPGYFPAVVDLEVFQRVQAQQIGGRAPKATVQGINNLLAGLAKCPCCDGTMTRVNKGKKGSRTYLVCAKAKAGAGCEYRAVPQEEIERALVDAVGWLVGTAPSGDEGLDQAMHRLETELDQTREEIGRLVDAIAEGRSPTIAAKVREAEAAAEEIEGRLREMAQRHMAVSGPMIERRMADLENALGNDTVDVTRANTLLRQVFDSITVDYRTGRLMCSWKQGGVSEVVFRWANEDV